MAGVGEGGFGTTIESIPTYKCALCLVDFDGYDVLMSHMTGICMQEHARFLTSIDSHDAVGGIEFAPQ